MTSPNLDGPVFSHFKATQHNYSDDTEACSARCVELLTTQATENARPGMLLGKIQSGKTRAFAGAIAIAFDNSFEVAIVFTKGTRALTRQTVARLTHDFNDAIQDERLLVYDIMDLPDNLSDWELSRQLLIVCKKEDDNLDRLTIALTETYPQLATRRLIIVDDEADFVSVGFRRTQDGIDSNVIPSQIDGLRQSLTNVSYLQVTATPYALYLQPENIEIPATQQTFEPIRPAFTVLVPIHNRYIGGEFYFEDSLEDGSVASYLHITVQPHELTVLRERNRNLFHIEDCLTSTAIDSLRRATVTFVVGGWIRRWQQDREGISRKRYSFIVHTETRTRAHDWQSQVVAELVTQLREAADNDPDAIRQLVQDAFDDLSNSLSSAELDMPDFEDVFNGFGDALRAVVLAKINSDSQAEQYLDETGQLELRTPYNIFIGGSILDRGLTIDNLIGFFYGRSPQQPQQDTVLQHCRMYGSRPPEDLAVTRFYTTTAIYSIMSMIHQFDCALREAFERGHDSGVVFLHVDPQRRLRPCNPNRILLSSVIALRPYGRLIPVGFTTSGVAISNTESIDELLENHRSDETVFSIPLSVASQIVDLIRDSLQMDPDRTFDFEGMKAAIVHLSSANSDAGSYVGSEVVCLLRSDRNDRKYRASDPSRLQNAPESSGDDGLLDPERHGRPALLLYRENGATDRGWSGDPFYWPVLQAPPEAEPVIFAEETAG